MLRTALAVTAGKAARAVSRLRGGGGSALPGLVVERLHPRFLTDALADVRGIVVVSGTNGKTTTTKMLVAVLRAHGRDAHQSEVVARLADDHRAATVATLRVAFLSALVLELVATGRSNAEIASALYVSHATVKTHVSRLLMKLDARDRAQLVMVAYETGVVVPGAG